MESRGVPLIFPLQRREAKFVLRCGLLLIISKHFRYMVALSDNLSILVNIDIGH